MVKVNESKLVDERIPEINWVDGVEETLPKVEITRIQIRCRNQ